MSNVTIKETTQSTINILVIRTLCKERGLTVTKLADLTNMSKSGLSKIFSRKANMSLTTLLQIAGALHVPASEIMKTSEVIGMMLAGGKQWVIRDDVVKTDALLEFIHEYFSNRRLTVESTSNRLTPITGFNLVECPVIKALKEFDSIKTDQ